MKYLVLLVLPFAFMISCQQDVSSPRNIKDSLITIFDTVTLKADSLLQLSLKKNLWAYYNFNGDLKDKSGNSRDMTGYNNIQLSYDIFGNDNNALAFNGAGNYAVIPAGAEFPEGDFSVSFLMMSKTLRGTIYQRADIKTAKGASFGVGFDDNNIDSDPSTNISIEATSDSDICDKYVSLPLYLFASKKLYTDAWYFVTYTFNKGTEKIYINGSLLGTKQISGTTLKSCPLATLNLGIWWQNDPHFFSGKIDELRIYSRPLEENEVKYLSQTTLQQ